MTECRSIELRNLEVNSSNRRIVGVAAAYETLSSDLGGFREKIAPTAFTKSIGENDIRALYNHDNAKILGRISAGTLKLASTSRGLEFDLTLPNTSYANDLVELMARGDVTSCSFGFFTRSDKWSTDPETKTRIRTLHDVDLREISIVGDPAYPSGTSAALRSLDAWKSNMDYQHKRCLFSFLSRRNPPRS